MISPKYASTHYYHSAKALAKHATFPNVVNLYLDYNCVFSARIFGKILQVVPELEKKHPGQFQFVFVDVIQPWHPNSVLLHEYALVVAQLLKESAEETNKSFWAVSGTLFKNIEQFYDSETVTLGRNDIYKAINDLVYSENDLPFAKEKVLERLQIQVPTDTTEKSKQSRHTGNGATVDVKYFTKYLRGVGVHVTPTVSVNGIVDNSISSGNSVEELIKTFEGYLWVYTLIV